MSSSVSIVIANRNHSGYLRELLSDIFAQTLKADEVIIVDDCSTDDSRSMLAEISAAHPSVKVLLNSENRGTNFSANRGMKEAKGEFITFHSARNRLTPGFLEASVTMLNQFPSAAFCCSFFGHIDTLTGGVGSGDPGWSNIPRYFSSGELADVKPAGSIPGHSSVYRKNLFEACGAHPEELAWHSDWFTTQVVAARFGVCYIPAALAFIRLNDPKSYSATGMRDWEKQRVIVRRILDKLLSAEYSDVLPFFQNSQAMVGLFEDAKRLIMEDPLIWSSEQLLAISKTFKPEQQEDLAKRIEMAVTVINGLHPELRERMTNYRRP